MQFDSSGSSSVFDFSLTMAAQIEATKPFERSEGSIIYMGVDPAGQGKDYACAIALALEKG